MENRGWIKLYKKIVDHDIFHDSNALKILLWLFAKVDTKTGQKKIARSWVAQELRMKPTTFYDALKRLETRYKMTTTSPTANFTIISLINWEKYQSTDRLPVASPLLARHTNRYKNKEYIKKESIEKENSMGYLTNIPTTDIQAFTEKFEIQPHEVQKKGEELLNYCEMHGKQYKNYKAFLRNVIQRDFKKKKIKGDALSDLIPDDL